MVRRAVVAHYRAVAPFLEQELAQRGDEDFWRSLAREQPNAQVLDLGAGSGRVTALLAPLARLLVAVDISAELLALARRRLQPFSQVKLVRADMRRLALRTRFDLVAAANDPFCHLLSDRDRRRALRVVARHLAPSGRFVLDGLWFPARGPRFHRALAHWFQQEGVPVRLLERWWIDPPSHRCRARYEYTLRGRPTVVSEFTARYWSVDEVQRAFRDAGLAVEAVWGDYERTPWDEQRAERLLVVAVRRGRGAARR